MASVACGSSKPSSRSSAAISLPRRRSRPCRSTNRFSKQATYFAGAESAPQLWDAPATTPSPVEGSTTLAGTALGRLAGRAVSFLGFYFYDTGSIPNDAQERLLSVVDTINAQVDKHTTMALPDGPPDVSPPPTDPNADPHGTLVLEDNDGVKYFQQDDGTTLKIAPDGSVAIGEWVPPAYSLDQSTLPLVGELHVAADALGIALSPAQAYALQKVIVDLFPDGGWQGQVDRLLDLAIDPDKGMKPSPEELSSAIRLERELGMTVTRAPGGMGEDVIDGLGRSWDFIGSMGDKVPNFDIDQFLVRLSEKINLEAADRIAVDISQFDTPNAQRVRDFISELSPIVNSRIVVLE